MVVQIQLRRDTAARWIHINPVLAEAEMAVEMDTGKIKIGDGVHRWTELDYFVAFDQYTWNIDCGNARSTFTPLETIDCGNS